MHIVPCLLSFYHFMMKRELQLFWSNLKKLLCLILLDVARFHVNFLPLKYILRMTLIDTTTTPDSSICTENDWVNNFSAGSNKTPTLLVCPWRQQLERRKEFVSYRKKEDCFFSFLFFQNLSFCFYYFSAMPLLSKNICFLGIYINRLASLSVALTV